MKRLVAAVVMIAASLVLVVLPNHLAARGADLVGGSCSAKELYASGYWLGATGSLAGPIYLANVGNRTCALRGYPQVVLRSQTGRTLHVRLEQVGAHMRLPAIKRPHTVTLPPEQQQGTQVMIQWFNYCGAPVGTAAVSLTLPGVHQLVVHPLSSVSTFLGAARCDDRRRPSTLLVSPVERNPSLPSGAPPGATATAIPVGTPLCAPSQVTVHGGRQGGGFVGVALGTAVLTNTGTGTCVLSGMPSVSLVTSAGTALAIMSVPPVSLASTAVLLKPARAAEFDFDWTNWCGAPPGPLDIKITLAGNTSSISGPFNGPPSYDLVPICRNSSEPSTLMLSATFYGV